MVEVYYNSGQFSATIKLLERKFAETSRKFLRVWRNIMRENGLTGISHCRLARYEILYKFLEEKKQIQDRGARSGNHRGEMSRKPGWKIQREMSRKSAWKPQKRWRNRHYQTFETV